MIDKGLKLSFYWFLNIFCFINPAVIFTLFEYKNGKYDRKCKIKMNYYYHFIKENYKRKILK